MSYKDYIWKNRVINGTSIKSIRIRVFDVPKKCKRSKWLFERYYTDSKKITSRQVQNFSILILTSDAMKMGVLDTKENNKFIRVKIYITPEFEFSMLEKLHKQFDACDETIYPYIENALQQHKKDM